MLKSLHFQRCIKPTNLILNIIWIPYSKGGSSKFNAVTGTFI